MTRNRWIIFVSVCVLILVGLVVFTKKGGVDVTKVDPSKIVAASSGVTGDHVFGNKDSKVILIEYGDFQCPGCGAVYPQLKTITEKYQDKIAFVFRNFPLTTLHPNAFAAATAAESVALQGNDKYWLMNNTLYDNQNNWAPATTDQRGALFSQYAGQVGADLKEYNDGLSSKQVSDKIAFDRALGGKLGLNSTPSLFLNGKKLSGDVINDLGNGTGDQLIKMIDTALKAVGQTPPAN